MDDWSTRKLEDKDVILRFLERDRGYAAYAIGDLDPHLFNQSQWVCAEFRGEIKALALLFYGLNLPVLFLMGAGEGLALLLRTITKPERAYLACRPEHLQITQPFYSPERSLVMLRMVFEPMRFRPISGPAVRLGVEHLEALRQLYTQSEGSIFSPYQLAQGIFYGILKGGRLVAAAGTHLVSHVYGVAALGNVVTHPDYREQGYGTLCTSMVVQKLLKEGLRDIVLNVEQDNSAAIHIYERLGFGAYCPFIDAVVVRRAEKP